MSKQAGVTAPAQAPSAHALAIEEVFRQLQSGPQGLSAQEAEQRLAEYGPNQIQEERGANPLALILSQLLNPLVAVLIVAAIISLVVGETIDAIVIAVVIVVNTAIGFYQEYQAEKAIAALKTRAAPEAKVLRDCGQGQCVESRIDATQLVPGDVVVLSAGDRVPADARLLEAANMQVDESMLTGESAPVGKTTEPLAEELPVAERTNLVFGGTAIVQGRGHAVVFATGSRTEIGKIATLIQEAEQVTSPLQAQTARLSTYLGALALFASVLVFVVGLVRGMELREMFLFALATAVSAIPEGLPAVMTVTLAVGVTRMARRNAIIRRLPAVDTLGATTTICTDKTGTLTTNEMTVQRMFFPAGEPGTGRTLDISGTGFAPEGAFTQDRQPVDVQQDEDLRLALRIGALANDARLVRREAEGREHWEIVGDPTEGALVVAAAKAELNKEDQEKEWPRVDEIPFNSQEKYMATFHRVGENRALVLVKGAPEVVLDLSSQTLAQQQSRQLNADDRELVSKANTDMAGQALRVLGLAYQEIDLADVAKVKEELQSKKEPLVFAGLAGMMDPPRPEVPEAVERCQRAGIRVMMATGDHQVTGEAIARQVGILRSQEQALTGTEMERMSDEDLDAVILNTAVFARVSPEHKYRIVESLRRKDQVVAMTGDGVNDAPALKMAEIGVAMGITGADVTRETADMVLTDDNFASIVNAVEEGRVVFENVRKVVKYLLATNVAEVVTIISALLLLPLQELIITPVQLLWVNLVTDGLLVITLALEPKEGDVMEKPPRRPNTPIINREILWSILYVSLFMAIGTLGIYTWIRQGGDATRAQTAAFSTMAFFQIFNALNVRSPTRSIFQVGPFSNRYLLAAVITSIGLQVLAVQAPLLQTALGTAPLGLREWGFILLVTGSILVFDEVRKVLARRAERRKVGSDA